VIECEYRTFWAGPRACPAIAGTGHSMGERWTSVCLERPGKDGRYAHTSLSTRNRLHSASSRDPAQEAMDTVCLYSANARPGEHLGGDMITGHAGGHKGPHTTSLPLPPLQEQCILTTHHQLDDYSLAASVHLCWSQYSRCKGSNSRLVVHPATSDQR
jgi:hypothetical protein